MKAKNDQNNHKSGAKNEKDLSHSNASWKWWIWKPVAQELSLTFKEITFIYKKKGTSVMNWTTSGNNYSKDREIQGPN